MKSIILIKDFAGKKEGHEFTNLGGILCSQLVNTQKVAVYKEDYKQKTNAKKSSTKKDVSDNAAETIESKGSGKKVK
jgi:hypothetical protein